MSWSTATARSLLRRPGATRCRFRRPVGREHDPNEDWWGDFVFITRKLLADSAIDPVDIRAIGCSAIGPCMLPVDGDGRALMNGVLYGVDNRAASEVDELTAKIGEDVLLQRCGNALTSQSVGPKILWLKRHRPDLSREDGKDPHLHDLHRRASDGQGGHRPLYGGQFFTALRCRDL